MSSQKLKNKKMGSPFFIKLFLNLDMLTLKLVKWSFKITYAYGNIETHYLQF